MTRRRKKVPGLYTPEDLADELDVSKPTLRRASKEVEPFLSDSAAKRWEGASSRSHRRYTDKDRKFLEAFLKLVHNGRSYDEVLALVDDAPSYDEALPRLTREVDGLAGQAMSKGRPEVDDLRPQLAERDERIGRLEQWARQLQDLVDYLEDRDRARGELIATLREALASKDETIDDYREGNRALLEIIQDFRCQNYELHQRGSEGASELWNARREMKRLRMELGHVRANAKAWRRDAEMPWPVRAFLRRPDLN
jgi:DNA-binding transcriptional MerR regulator